MSPFKRGKYWSLYVPRQSGGLVQRACGTTDAKLAKQMGRMIDLLADQRRWDVLEAIDTKAVTVAQAYDAYAMNALDRLLADLKARALRDMADAWLLTLTQKPKTIVSYRQKIATLIPHGMLSSELTPGWISDTIAALPVSSGTKRQYLHVLSMFLDYCVGHGVLAFNPVQHKGLVKAPRNNKPRAVWKDEADDIKLVNSAPEPYRSFFALVHGSGAERNAALAMTRSDVDMATWTLRIPGTKTATRDRKGVPLEAWARPIVAAHCKGLLPDAPLFPTLTSATVNHVHQEARTAAKLDGYQLRDARHSYAVRALLRGEPLWKVSKWLGHSNVAITAKVYTQFGLDAALEALGRQSAVSTTGTTT